jgi:hypothetical protein
MKGKLIVVVGMPGSGKSTYKERLMKDGEIDVAFDDYQGEAYNDSGDPHVSKNYGPMLAALKDGQRILVTDIIFCEEAALHKFLVAVFEVLPDIYVEFRYFENAPEKCIQNARKHQRSTETIEKEINFIQAHATTYRIPKMAELEVKTGD